MSTTDGGITWHKEIFDDFWPLSTFYCLDFPGNGKGWVSGRDGLLLSTLVPVNIEDLVKDVKLTVFPNPTYNKTTIRFELQERDEVTLSLFNMNGQQIKHIFSEKKNTGTHQVEIDCSNYAKGLYLIKLQSGNDIVTKNLVVN